MCIFVDAVACPVKDEVYRVAARYRLRGFVVANSPIAMPRAPEIALVVVGMDSDAADDWIAERTGPGAIVVTSDIPLASRGVKGGADVIAPNGKRFNEDSSGMALATRNMMDHLRSTGQATSGPKAFGPRDRLNFLNALMAAPLPALNGIAAARRDSGASSTLHSPSRAPISCAKRRAGCKQGMSLSPGRPCDASEPLDHQGTGWPRQSKNPPLASAVS